MTTMSVAQLIIMAVIVVALMAMWLSLVFLADREPRRPRAQTPAGKPPGGRATSVPSEGTALAPPPGEQATRAQSTRLRSTRSRVSRSESCRARS